VPKKKSSKKSSKKKSSKKSTTKKSKAKKAQSKTEVTITKHILGEAPEEYHFVLKSGEKLKSVQELADALESMGEDVFSHHVNEMRNDFAQWIEDVFEESDLAEGLRETQNRIETRIKVLQRLIDEVIKEGKNIK